MGKRKVSNNGRERAAGSSVSRDKRQILNLINKSYDASYSAKPKSRRGRKRKLTMSLTMKAKQVYKYIPDYDAVVEFLLNQGVSLEEASKVAADLEVESATYGYRSSKNSIE